MEENNFIPKLTFVVKNPTTCRLCDTVFYRESLLTGGGRLNADVVTDTLHRNYKPSQKFGSIHPLIYSVIVCPNCFFASLFQSDFENPPEENIDKLIELKMDRIEFANTIIGEPVDFTKARTLKIGASAYALALLCYEYYPRKSLPVIKQAISAIRAAFLFEDLEKEIPKKNFNAVSELFYKKSLVLYKKAIELNQSKAQIMESLKSYGPDIDRNYGYDGILYLIGILAYKYGSKEDPAVRRKELDDARLYMGKLFGMGKSDFEKPKELLEKSKLFHEIISKEIKELDGES